MRNDNLAGKQLILLGMGGFGREVAAWALDQFDHAGDSERVIWFCDDNVRQNQGPRVQYLGTIAELVPTENMLAVAAFNEPQSKRAICSELSSKGLQWTNIIHPSAIIARTAKLGQGLIICPYSMIANCAQVGDHVHLNAHSSIGHDAVVADHASISCYCDITGNVKLGDGVFMGSGARVLPGCSVAAGSVIGAGAIVHRSISKATTLFNFGTKKIK